MKILTTTEAAKSEVGRAVLIALPQKKQILIYPPDEKILRTEHPVLPSAVDIIQEALEQSNEPIVAAGARLSHLVLDFRPGGGLHNAPWTVKAVETILTGAEIATAWPPWQELTAKFGPIVSEVHAVFTKGEKAWIGSVSQRTS